MRFDIITLFPTIFQSLEASKIFVRAKEKKLLEMVTHDLRPFGSGPHQAVDDAPYGGGAGMVLKIEPLVKALESIERKGRSKVLLLSPQGETLSHTMAKSLSTEFDQLILICGRYEGVDERLLNFIDGMVSIGDYVMSGGEFGALVLVDVISRLIPQVVGREESVETDSFACGTLKYPQYTKPQSFRGLNVPDVLLTGNHQKIEQFRKLESEKNTRERKPFLLSKK